MTTRGITGKTIFSKNTAENLETRTVAAAELFQEGYYPTIKAAAIALCVPYKRLWSRIKGHHPVSKNGGNFTLLQPEEEAEVICWAHRRIIQGHHIQRRSLQQHANTILRAKERETRASRSWAQRFMRRHRDIFHRRRAVSRDAKRKAMQDRASVDAFFKAWSNFIADHGIKRDNIWNFDETGFMVGYLQKGTFLWTFNEIDKPVLTDAHDTVSVTAIEAISASGEVIPSFLILPGVQIPVRWVDNDLDGDTIITTSPKGYTNDIIAIEWIKHFELHTRPRVKTDTRLILMDGCDNHFTVEIVHFCHDHNIELFPLPPHLTHYLQPLDVGVFRSYKHWHQQVLYREIADGAADFNKTDFLYHLQEIRTRSFKKHTILSSWEKCGLFPYNPAIVLDQLQDALSSLTQDVDKQDLPGAVGAGKYDENIIRALEAAVTPRGTRCAPAPRTPLTKPLFDWNSVTTPKHSLMLLAQLQQYVKIRIEGCLESDVPLTPSVRHVLSKANRAGRILALNGIMATSEMAIIKEKQLRRSTLKEGTQVVARFGPLSVHDARVRVARDEYNRRASQEDEARRIRKKRSREEVPFVRRWMRDLRSVARNSVTKWRLSEMRRRGGLTKADFRAYLDNPEQLCLHYRLFRELKHKGKIVNSFTWPEEYDVDIIDDAVLLLATEYHDRVSSRKALSLEVDGIEITQIHDIEAEGDENEVIKVEDANEAAPSADALI
ncbi:hypothetical protein HIM_01646 [Hirsutella minnesotensis 3608]|nr:hypothetical protein HIM_01646 [Hirsutella minnesotensis 3608]